MPLELNEHVDALAHITAYIVAREPGARLQNQQRKLLDRALRRVGVDSGHRSGMAGIDRAQEGKRLDPALSPVSAYGTDLRL